MPTRRIRQLKKPSGEREHVRHPVDITDDGKWLAFFSDKGGRPRLYVWNRKTNRLLIHGEDDRAFSQSAEMYGGLKKG